MKKYTFIFSLFLLLPSFGYCQIPQPDKNVPLELIIKSDKRVYEEGEAIYVTLTLRNISNEKVSINTAALKRTFLLGSCDICDSKNTKIPWGVKIEVPDNTEEDYFVLDPGQIVDYRINISQGMFHRLKPDRYTIKCHYVGQDNYRYMVEESLFKKVDYAWTGTIVSNTISMQVESKEKLPVGQNNQEDVPAAIIQPAAESGGSAYREIRRTVFSAVGEYWQYALGILVLILLGIGLYARPKWARGLAVASAWLIFVLSVAGIFTMPLYFKLFHPHFIFYLTGFFISGLCLRFFYRAEAKKEAEPSQNDDGPISSLPGPRIKPAGIFICAWIQMIIGGIISLGSILMITMAVILRPNPGAGIAIVALLFFAALGLPFVLIFIAGVGLLRFKPWARVMTLVVFSAFSFFYLFCALFERRLLLVFIPALVVNLFIIRYFTRTKIKEQFYSPRSRPDRGNREKL